VSVNHLPAAAANPGSGSGRRPLLPDAVAALVRPRRVLVADPTTTTDEVAGTRVEIRTAPTEQELAAEGLTPLTRPARTATDVAVRFLLSFPLDTTRRSYSSDLRGFDAWCAAAGITDVLAVTRSVIDTHASWAAEHIVTTGPDGTETTRPRLAARTRARRLAALTSFYDYASEEGLLPGANPAARVRRPVIDDDDPGRALTARQLATLLAAAEAHSPVAHATVCLLGLNGLRVAEACSIDVEGYSARGQHRTISFTRKRGKRTTQALPPRGVAAIEAAIGDRTTGPLLTTSTGRRLSPQQAWRTIGVLARRTELAPLTPHDLRRTYITLAREAGSALEDVQDSAGHSSADTTRRYDKDRHRLDRAPSYDVAAMVARQAPSTSGQASLELEPVL
jgi:site-specific recombinase XerD